VTADVRFGSWLCEKAPEKRWPDEAVVILPAGGLPARCR
jgi:hypothetical protein